MDRTIIAVASGKGGTGKTTVATNLARVAAIQGLEVSYLDCDVEEPNGHIFLKPEIEMTASVCVPVPVVDEEQDIIPSSITLEDITEMVLRFGESGKEARFVKEGDTWKIQTLYGVDAEKSTLERFLKQLDGLKGELRSEDAGLFEDYGIGDGQGFHIILEKDASAVLHLVVGLKRSGASGNFGPTCRSS